MIDDMANAGARPRYQIQLPLARWARNGKEEGDKDRPCAVVATLPVLTEAASDADAPQPPQARVYVLPITHTKPTDMGAAIEIPPKVKQHLRLDDEPSWVIVSEWNEFTWPGPDLRRTPTGEAAYGMLPPSLFEKIKSLYFARIRAGHTGGAVRRTE